jgi:glycosyltransferase involved in cell wall biosynthesis
VETAASIVFFILVISIFMKARVIHIITKLELGGAQQNTLYTVEHLDRERFSAALWSGDGGILNDDAKKVPDLDFIIVPELIREIRPDRDYMAFWQLYTMLRDEVQFSKAPVIVHTHSSKAGVLGRLAARRAKVPVTIHTFHGFGFNDFQKWPIRRAFIMAEKIAGRVTDHFIAVSRANLDKAVGMGIAAKEKIRVIRSGIKIKEFEPRPGFDKKEMKRSLGLDPEKPLALMVACFKPQKSPMDFVKAAALAAKQAPDAQFAVAGDGTLRPAMEAAIKREGLEGRLELLGWRRDVPELLWSADVLVLTSLWEGLPRVYPQAVAAGVPIVGTRVDGGPEAVTDGENGWLLEPRDVKGIADRMAELLKDPEKAKAMGRAGRSVLPEFDIDLMVRQQEELYEQLLKKKRVAGSE